MMLSRQKKPGGAMRAGAWDGIDVRRVRFAYPPGIQPMHL